jgi:hypothetical protein
MRDVRAKSDDSSSRLLPRNDGWLIAIAALPNVQIDEVHAAGRDMDKYFTIAGSGPPVSTSSIAFTVSLRTFSRE